MNNTQRYHLILEKTGGAPAEALFNTLNENRSNRGKSAFFQPYTSPASFFLQTTTIVTAPISLTLISIEIAVYSICKAIQSIIELGENNTGDAKYTIVMSGLLLLASIIAFMTALLSPLINVINLIGSSIVSAKKESDNQEEIQINGPALCQ